MRWMILCVGLFTSSSLLADEPVVLDPAKLHRLPKELKVSVDGGKVTFQHDRWAYLLAPDDHRDIEVAASFTIEEPARQFQFFGESWSVWPDPTFSDGGFEASLLLRGSDDGESGYRLQWSHKYQVLALVKFPSGGYVRVCPCHVPVGKPVRVTASVRDETILVSVDGKEVVRYDDELSPLTTGRVGVGVSSQARVMWKGVTLDKAPLPPAKPIKLKHVPEFQVRKFLGDRLWVFDGDEPILLLPTPESSYINNVKLQPGLKPLLSWNGHWDIQNQGAFPEGLNQMGAVTTKGGGDTVTAAWSARQVKDRFTTQTTLTIGYDNDRGTYRYDVESALEVGKEPFHFRYGYDFEHHTPLDPFKWQYLVVRRTNERLAHRPVYPIDPGGISDVEGYHGLRMWQGRHNTELPVVPAVEYQIDPAWNVRKGADGKAAPLKLGTAVCAAFYDTGVSFEPETAPPGTKVRVKYRYTGYSTADAERLFAASKIHASHMLDPKHHYIFAEWPKQTFSQAVPMSKTWIYGRTPFMTAHNARPAYDLVQKTGVGSGFAMKLGPASFGAAVLPIPKPLHRGRYMLVAKCRGENLHGPGGRIELKVLEAKTQKPLGEHLHFIGNGTFDWKTSGFAFEVPQDSAAISLGFGNQGTGAALFAEVDIQALPNGQALPEGVSAEPRHQSPAFDPAPKGAIADYRFVEQAGLHALDFAQGPLGNLELANIAWSKDEGHLAIRFQDNVSGKASYPIAGGLDRSYFGHTSYADKQTLPVAIAGHHGGGMEWKAFTVAAWVKPAAEMGKSEHGGKGDIVGLGARRFILSLVGQSAPYQLEARLNVNDRLTASDSRLEADRWYHVAMTGEPTGDKKWQVRLFLDGKRVLEGTSEKLEAPMTIPPSLILGTEIFYMHDAHYRGLIGRTLVFDRAVPTAEIANLMELR